MHHWRVRIRAAATVASVTAIASARAIRAFAPTSLGDCRKTGKKVHVDSWLLPTSLRSESFDLFFNLRVGLRLAPNRDDVPIIERLFFYQGGGELVEFFTSELSKYPLSSQSRTISMVSVSIRNSVSGEALSSAILTKSRTGIERERAHSSNRRHHVPCHTIHILQIAENALGRETYADALATIPPRDFDVGHQLSLAFGVMVIVILAMDHMYPSAYPLGMIVTT